MPFLPSGVKRLIAPEMGLAPRINRRFSDATIFRTTTPSNCGSNRAVAELVAIMTPRLAFVYVLLATRCVPADDRGRSVESDRASAAVVHKAKLVCLDEKGRFFAWNLEDVSFDAVTSSKLTLESVTHIAASGDELWATDKSTLYSWSDEEKSWKQVCDFDRGGERLETLIGVAGSPLLVFRSRVEDVRARRTFKVPNVEGHQIDFRRVLAFFTTDSMLWIGTGYGEWGGHLVGLNARTGEWMQYYDALHYVTGITQAKPNEMIVSWSMSHLGADTLIRIHNPDGTPKTPYPELDSKYYQTIVYSPFDKTLYGVENTEVVTIEEGKPSKVAVLDGRVFDREPDAIGVSPGVSSIIPVGRKSLVIVPKSGLPWTLRDGNLTRLRP
jgi:hypothetical protein